MERNKEIERKREIEIERERENSKSVESPFPIRERHRPIETANRERLVLSLSEYSTLLFQPFTTMTSAYDQRYNYEPLEGSSIDDEILYSRRFRRQSNTSDELIDIPELIMNGMGRLSIVCCIPKRFLSKTLLLISFIGLLIAHQMQPIAPSPPMKLLQGCPPELIHSRSFRQVQLLCRTAPSLVVAAYEGIKDSMGQCEDRMRFLPWDCTHVGNVLLDPPLLRYAYKESALVWSLSSAGAAWGISTACTQGWLSECACTPTPGQTQWEWGGCSYGVQYGISASRKLLTRTVSTGRSPLRQAEKHNLKAGRLAVKKTLISSCKCHGVSGSCQQKTCWKKTADLETITKHLVEKYHRTRVVSEESKAKNADLLAFEHSSDHCTNRPSSPRICGWRNETHSQGDCGRLCCGRGFTIKHEVVTYKCDCKFVWCCNLVCNDCIQHRWVSTCN